MNNQFSPRVSQVLVFSKEEACRLQNEAVTPEHLLLGLLRENEGTASQLLRQLHIRLDSIKKEIEGRIGIREKVYPPIQPEDVTLNEASSRIIKLGILEARLMKCTLFDTEHLLLAILRDNQTLASEILMKYDVRYEELFQILTQKHDIQNGFGFDDDEDELQDNPEQPQQEKNTTTSSIPHRNNSDTPMLDHFGIDLTKTAEKGNLDPVVGRNNEVERIAQILSRRKKNNPILIGEPGVGKSAIVEGLALRIVQKRVPRSLFNKRIVALDMASVVAGTKYRGQFEERIRNIIGELQKNSDIILFIDEIHTIIGTGSTPGSMDAANMLKPALARGEVQCIGATTIDEFRKSIEKDGALDRRFQKIMVEPTSVEETLQILNNIKDKYEDHHNVRYTDDAINACVKLTERYISDRCFPDKAIDVLDEAGSRIHVMNANVSKEIEEQEKAIDELRTLKDHAVKHQEFEKAAMLRDQIEPMEQQLEEMKAAWEKEMKERREIVDRQQIEETVSLMSGIPVQKMEQAENIRLKGMKETLQQQVIAQNTAIDKIVRAIMRSRLGIKDPNRPIGTFMFLGPTGVGKTLLAKRLAEYMFGTPDALIRIDMSEYMEKYSVSRLVGAPPGYVGYDEGGQLTEKVRRKPYSIILLDEIEKAHGDVFNLLLQVMDEGRLTDSNGSTIDFKNTVIIMTSNCGTRQVKDFGRGIGFSSPYGIDEQNQLSNNIIAKALNKQFTPEFLNRIDEIITFESLTEESIEQICEIELHSLSKRMEDMGYILDFEPSAKKFIATKGFDKQYGARPLKRAIQTYVEDKICEQLMQEEVSQPCRLTIGHEEGNEELSLNLRSL